LRTKERLEETTRQLGPYCLAAIDDAHPWRINDSEIAKCLTNACEAGLEVVKALDELIDQLERAGLV